MHGSRRSDMSPYSSYFKLRNKDPNNYVLFKDFYFYCILAIYVFYIWFLTSVFIHHDRLERNDNGLIIISLNYIVSLGSFMVLFLAFWNGRQEFPYSLAGIIAILFLVELTVLLAFYDKRDLDSDYARDPASIAITFLILYTFVSYFTC